MDKLEFKAEISAICLPFKVTVVAVSSDVDGIFTLKASQRMTLKTFLGGEDVVALVPNGFGRGLGKHHNVAQLATGR